MLPVVLYVGKLIPKKRPLDLLAASRLCQQPHRLVFMGDGQLHDKLRGEPYVSVTGFVNYSEIPRFYHEASVFVLPSEYEPWGLVLNEAMAAGLPVIVSSGVTAGVDLVKGNGFVYPTGDVKRLAFYLQSLLENPGLRSLMGQRSREIIGEFTYAEDVKGIEKALSELCGRKLPSDPFPPSLTHLEPKTRTKEQLLETFLQHQRIGAINAKTSYPIHDRLGSAPTTPSDHGEAICGGF